MPHNHSITLQEAVDLTKRYRNAKDSIPTAQYKDALLIAETFDKAAFEELTAEPGCVSIRCYLGLDAVNQIRLIFVGVNDKNEDILPAQGSPAGTALIMEQGTRCPPICPVESPLNPTM